MIYNGETPKGHRIFLIGEKLKTDNETDIYGFFFLGFINAPVRADFMLPVKKGLNEKKVLDEALKFIEMEDNGVF